jgi:chitodextrinase
MCRQAAVLSLLMACSWTAWSQVTLSTGVTVPKERFIVYIVVGNSEAEGQTTVRNGTQYRPLWDSTHARLWNFNVQDNNNPAPNYTWIPARGKNHAGSLASYPDWLGPEMPLLKELIKQYSSEYYFGVLKIANQGDRLRGQYLKNELGWAEVAEWTQIVNAIAAIGPNTVTWGGLFTVFCDMETHDVRMGYTGADGRLDSLAYDAMTLTSRVRQLTNPSLPLLFACPPGNYSGCIADGRRDVWDRLNAQLALLPTLDPRAVAVPVWWGDTSYVVANYVDADNGHYTAAGLVRLAEETVAIIKANGYVPPLGTDTQAPTAPTNLAATNVGSTSLTLSWTASTDDRGVSGYTVYRNGDSVMSAALTSATVAGLTASTAYTFTVKARDFSGKVSPLSAPLQVTTAPPGSDTQAPSVPAGLHAVSVGLTSATIAWTASTDNVGVTSYIVLSDGVPVDTVTATQVTLAGLTQQTTYHYTVVARDSTGNISLPGGPLSVTTGSPVAFPFKVNVGGPAMGAYLADKQWSGVDYGYTGTTSVATGSGDVRGTTEDSMYYTERIGADMGYRVVVPNGIYDITFMFAEYWWGAGNRVFTPFINGVAATAQPIDVAAAVGLSAAYAVTVRTEVATGLIDITFTHQGGSGSGEIPILNGLSVDNAPAFTLLGPADNDTCRVGDTLHVRWRANTYLVTGVDVYLTIDEGENWHLSNVSGTIFARDTVWGNYVLVVPQQLGGLALAGRRLSIKLSGYNSSFSTEMPGSLTVLAGSSLSSGGQGRAAVAPGVRMVDGNRVLVQGVAAGSRAVLEIHSLNGSLIERRQFNQQPAGPFALDGNVRGTVIAVLRTGERRLVARLVMR